jgi:hypothetical protein
VATNIQDDERSDDGSYRRKDIKGSGSREQVSIYSGLFQHNEPPGLYSTGLTRHNVKQIVYNMLNM